jgi:hypothetical protein
VVSNSAGNCSRSATWSAILLRWLGGDRRRDPHGPSARARHRQLALTVF